MIAGKEPETVKTRGISMDCTANDWVDHPSFGIGRASEDRGDRPDIEFITSGAKTILESTDLKPALSTPRISG